MTVEFFCVDDWDCSIYKCTKTGTYYKADESIEGEIVLYTCGNAIDGDMGFPIGNEVSVTFTSKRKIIPKELRFNYMLLSRLQSDCEYYLGYGGRCKDKLYCGDEQEQIDKMKELYNGFLGGEKPEWIDLNRISEYEKEMVKAIKL